MFKASGDEGTLWVGYHKSVHLANWDLLSDFVAVGQLDTRLHGTVKSIDEFWSTQAPTALWLWMGKSWWVWRRVRLHSEIKVGTIIEVQVDGDPVTSQ